MWTCEFAVYRRWRILSFLVFDSFKAESEASDITRVLETHEIAFNRAILSRRILHFVIFGIWYLTPSDPGPD